MRLPRPERYMYKDNKTEKKESRREEKKRESPSAEL